MSQDYARLFFAFELSGSVKRHLGELIETLKRAIESTDREARRSVKWSRPENIHLTVKFLGDTPRNKIPALVEAANAYLSKTNAEPFTFSSTKIGAFPNANRPRVIWTDLSGDQLSELKKFVTGFEEALSKLGLEPEKREFKAHLTLGRVREGANTRAITTALNTVTMEKIEVNLQEFVLFESELKSEGPTYTVIKRWKLESQPERFGK